MSEQGDVIVKAYKGSQDEATRIFQDDVGVMATKGYFPTSQSYVPGSYGSGAFIIALILCFAVIGILILVYMLIVKPDGVLSVTYEFRGTVASKAQDEKTCPECAEQVKVAAQVCRFCGYQFDATTIVTAEDAVRETARKKEAMAMAIQKTTLAYRLGKWVSRQRAKNRARRPG